MHRYGIALLLLAGLAPLHAGEPKNSKEVRDPLGPAPELARIKLAMEGNKVLFQITRPRQVTEYVTQQRVQADGTVVTVAVPITRTVLEVATNLVDGKNLRLVHRDGKDYSSKEVAKLLDKVVPVAIFTGAKVDSYYVSFLRDDVLLLVRAALPPGTVEPASPVPVPAPRERR